MGGKPQAMRDTVVLLLVNGMCTEGAEAFLLGQGLDVESARATVAEARNRITVAADYTRDR